MNDADEGQPNYTKSIDEAKSLIKQLEAYKNMSTNPAPSPDSDTAVVPKGKADVSKI